MIEKIIQRIQSMFSIGTIMSVDDSQPLQLVDVDGQGDERFAGVERIQPYGLTSNPDEGAETVLIHIGGLREHPIAIVIDDSSARITGLKKGEVCFYSRHGQTILLNEDGEVVINGGTEKAVKGDTFKSTYDGHVHPTAFGPSGAPAVPFPTSGLNDTVLL